MDRLKFHPVDHAPAVPLDGYEARAGEDREVRRHGIVGYIEASSDLSGGKAVWLLLYQEPKGLQPCGLGKGGEGVNCEILFHLSGSIDEFCDSQVKESPPKAFEASVWIPTRDSQPSNDSRMRKPAQSPAGANPRIPA